MIKNKKNKKRKIAMAAQVVSRGPSQNSPQDYQALISDLQQDLCQLLQKLSLENFIDPWERDVESIKILRFQIAESRAHIAAKRREWQRDAGLEKAHQFFLSGDYDHARREYAQVLELHPDHVPALLGLAKSYSAIGDKLFSPDLSTRIRASDDYSADIIVSFLPRLGDESKGVLNEIYGRALEIFEYVLTLPDGISCLTSADYRVLGHLYDVHNEYATGAIYYSRAFLSEEDFYQDYIKLLLSEYDNNNPMAILRSAHILSDEALLAYAEANFASVYDKFYKLPDRGVCCAGFVYIYFGMLYSMLLTDEGHSTTKWKQSERMRVYAANASIQFYLLALYSANRYSKKEQELGVVSEWLRKIDARLNESIFQNIFNLLPSKNFPAIKTAFIMWIRHDLAEFRLLLDIVQLLNRMQDCKTTGLSTDEKNKLAAEVKALAPRIAAWGPRADEWAPEFKGWFFHLRTGALLLNAEIPQTNRLAAQVADLASRVAVRFELIDNDPVCCDLMNDADALYSMAMIYQYLKKLDKAIEYADKTLKVNGAHMGAQEKLGKLSFLRRRTQVTASADPGLTLKMA